VGVGWRARGLGGEMTQALYAHMNNKTIKKKERTEGEYKRAAKLLSTEILASLQMTEKGMFQISISIK
jgi:hypothetical protein